LHAWENRKDRNWQFQVDTSACMHRTASMDEGTQSFFSKPLTRIRHRFCNTENEHRKIQQNLLTLGLLATVSELILQRSLSSGT